VEHVIGDGGLGVVLKATHQQLGQPVAIKHLKPNCGRLMSAGRRQDIGCRCSNNAREPYSSSCPA
jgi:hypothetical protein